MQYAIKSGLVIYERHDHAPMPAIEGAEYLRVPDELAGWFHGPDGLGPDPRPDMPAEVLAQIERAGIENDLADLTMLTIDPLRAVVVGTATQVEHNRLASIEAAARELRSELQLIGGQNGG